MRKGPVYPSSFLDKIDLKDRPMGAAGWTMEEAQGKRVKNEEKKERRFFEAWLNRNGLLWDASSTRKKTTNKIGFPDYGIFHNGMTLFVEWKSTGKKLTPEQEKWRIDLTNSGFKYLIEYQYEVAVKDLTKFFKLPFIR